MAKGIPVARGMDRGEKGSLQRKGGTVAKRRASSEKGGTVAQRKAYGERDACQSITSR